MEMDGGDGCTTVNLLNATELYTIVINQKKTNKQQQQKTLFPNKKLS